nr:DUF1828 domain-containing protein [Lactiplantibacillus plantarum]
MQLNANNLKTSYLKWLSKNEHYTNIDSSENSIVEIDTPFLDNEFDDIVLYAYSRIGDNILVTDDGWTIDNLESNGLSFDKRSKTRNNILTDTLDIFGVQKDQGSKKLYIRTDFDGFPAAKQRLVQAILKINDLMYLNRPTILDAFSDEVQKFFDKEKILYSRNKSISGKNALSFQFDFIIPRYDEGDRLVRTFSQPKRAKNPAKIFAWDSETIKKINGNSKASFIAILNDSENSTESVNSIFEDSLVQVILASKLADNIELLKN